MVSITINYRNHYILVRVYSTLVRVYSNQDIYTGSIVVPGIRCADDIIGAGGIMTPNTPSVISASLTLKFPKPL